MPSSTTAEIRSLLREDGVAVTADVSGRRLLTGQPFAEPLRDLLGVRPVGVLSGLCEARAARQAEHVGDFLIPLNDADLPDVSAGRREVVNAQRDSRD